MTYFTDDDVTAVMDGRDYLDEREALLILAAVAPLIAARALREAADAAADNCASVLNDDDPTEANRWADTEHWLRARAADGGQRDVPQHVLDHLKEPLPDDHPLRQRADTQPPTQEDK